MLDPCGPFFPGLPGCRRDRSNSSPHLPLTLLTRDADELCMAMRVFRRGCLPLLAAFLLSSVLALGKSGETPHFTYHSTAAEVRLTFFATDEHNHNIESLGKDDFAVVDDELIVRDFRSFTRAGVIKLDVVVLVDSSQSIVSRFRQEIAGVLQLISQTPWVADDRVSILSFGGMQPTMICAGNCRDSSASDRLFTERAEGVTPLFDAVVLAANFLSQRRDPGVRPVLILFSDGDDTISKNSALDAVEAALASDVQIYAVDLNAPKFPSQGTLTLQTMAESTGGRYFPIRQGAVKLMGAVLEDLHAAYTVTYELPSHAQGFHSVRILPTHNLNLQFRSRRGYFYQNDFR